MYRLGILLSAVCIFTSFEVFADRAGCGRADCCRKMGGVQYCDSSAGRYVCNNGRYSSCYCTRHAVMDMQAFPGCCMWQGGVFKFDELSGLMICNNGGVSEICSRAPNKKEKVAAW